MAQLANTFDSYDIRGLREDLSDIIYDVSPEETPFYSSTKKTKAANTYTEWQTDALRASGTNAHLEGDDTIAVARAATVRLGNYTQIFKDAVVVPDTDEGLNKAGRGKEMAYQIMKAAKEQKLDIERALFLNQARDAGSSVAPRLMAGLPTWLRSNTSEGSGGSDPAGDGTAARTDGTQRSFTQTLFDPIMQSIWTAGGTPDTVYIPPAQMTIALGFTGNNNQQNIVQKGQVAKLLNVYMTPWGTVEFKPSREMRARDVFILQSDKFAIPVLRGTKQTELAKTGDAEKRQIVTELSLASLNEKASGAVYDLT